MVYIFELICHFEIKNLGNHINTSNFNLFG